MLAGAAIYLAGGTKFNNLAVTFVGLAFVGIFVSGIFVPMIPEILCSAEIEVKKEALKRAGGLDPNSLSEVIQEEISQQRDRMGLNASSLGASAEGVSSSPSVLLP